MGAANESIRKPSASGELTRLLLRYADATGVDPEGLAARAGLALDELDHPEARVAAGPFFALLQAMAEQAGDGAFGLRLGAAAAGFPSGHVLLALMANSRDLGQAIERFFRYHALLADFVAPRVERTGGRVRLVLDGLHPDLAAERHYIEAVLAMLVGLIRKVTSSSFKPLEVRITHRAPGCADEAARSFGAPVLYGQTTNELVLSARDLERTLFLANPELGRSLERFAGARPARQRDAQTFADRVYGIARDRLLKGEVADLEGVAEAIQIAPRVLQLRLQREETAFRLVLDAVRADLARTGLADETVSLVDLAFLLGYSEQSAFTRAFKRWEGVSPGAYRRRLREQEQD